MKGLKNFKDVKKLHTDLFDNTSAFRNMAICALVIGIGDILCVVGDLVWLFGDMLVQLHVHHLIVLMILVPALLTIIASFVWLYIGIYKYLRHHEQVLKNKKALKRVKG